MFKELWVTIFFFNFSWIFNHNLLRFILVFIFYLNNADDIYPVAEEPTTQPLGCHKRMYTYRITQNDATGKQCWDDVKVMSCWGRCDSSEISDYKFPYKKSFHPVCVHAARQAAVTYLKNCHPEASEEARRYEYMEAVSCHCHTCVSSDTDCEAPSLNIGDHKITAPLLTFKGEDTSEYADYNGN